MPVQVYSLVPHRVSLPGVLLVHWLGVPLAVLPHYRKYLDVVISPDLRILRNVTYLLLCYLTAKQKVHALHLLSCPRSLAWCTTPHYIYCLSLREPPCTGAAMYLTLVLYTNSSTVSSTRAPST